MWVSRTIAVLFGFAGLCATLPVLAAEPIVEVVSRGQKIRAILLKPEKPVASVILLAGGHGNLQIAPDGAIGWGRRNQVVRTRANYQAAGFAVLVPDIAPDWKAPGQKGGVVQGYRFNPVHGGDIGALVEYMRGIAEPVFIVATSRGAVTAGVALLGADGKRKPDGMVLPSPMLVPVEPRVPSFIRAIQGNKAKAQVPMLLVGHRKDTCRWTLPETLEQFRAWRGGGDIEIVFLDGEPGSGDPCQTEAAHGFYGIDQQVVDIVAGWIKRQKR